VRPISNVLGYKRWKQGTRNFATAWHVDEAQGAAPSDLSCFGGKGIAFVALEAVISASESNFGVKRCRINGSSEN
jgi:hypothetical protein